MMKTTGINNMFTHPGGLSILEVHGLGLAAECYQLLYVYTESGAYKYAGF